MKTIPHVPNPRYEVKRYSTRQLVNYWMATGFWCGYYCEMSRNHLAEKYQHRWQAREKYRSLIDLRSRMRETLWERGITNLELMIRKFYSERRRGREHYREMTS